jgi:heme-based aerotactic transducer
MATHEHSELQITDADRSGVSGAALTDEIGIDRAEIAWRKEYTQFTEADADRLAGLRGLFDEIKDDLVEEFYDHLQAHDETVAIMDSSSKPIEVLKRDQRQYLLELGQGEYGQEYFDRRARIGKIHDMLDLGPKIYFGAYSIYYRGIVTAVAQELKTELDNQAAHNAVDRLTDQFLSIQKLINLDQQVAMDTYINSYSQEIEDVAREQEELMRRVETELQSPVEELSDASEDVAESATLMSDSLNQQTSQMESVADEVANMSATIEEIASTATEVTETSNRAERLAREGSDSASDALTAMEDIEAAVSDASTDMETVQSRMDDVNEFTTVIDDIAEQTNMLALNASIEAARAGEAGEGFAVVANEIKTLAEETASATQEVEDLIGTVEGSTESVAEDMFEMQDDIAEGRRTVNETVETLEAISEKISEANAGIQSINDATDEQADSTQEVVSMVDEVSEVSDRTADEAQNVSAAAEEQTSAIQQISNTAQSLSDRAEELDELTQQFETQDSAVDAGEAETAATDD